MATVRAGLKHPKGEYEILPLCRLHIVIILITACSLSYKHSENKYMEALEDSGWKAPQEVFRPTDFPNETQPQGQTTWLSAPFTLLFKAPMDGGCRSSWSKLFGCLTVLMMRSFLLMCGWNLSCVPLCPFSLPQRCLSSPNASIDNILQLLCLHLKDVLLQSSGAAELITRFLGGSGSVWEGCTTDSAFLQSSVQKE